LLTTLLATVFGLGEAMGESDRCFWRTGVSTLRLCFDAFSRKLDPFLGVSGGFLEEEDRVDLLAVVTEISLQSSPSSPNKFTTC
jgi:hypothetical protein